LSAARRVLTVSNSPPGMIDRLRAGEEDGHIRRLPPLGERAVRELGIGPIDHAGGEHQAELLRVMWGAPRAFSYSSCAASVTRATFRKCTLRSCSISAGVNCLESCKELGLGSGKGGGDAEFAWDVVTELLLRVCDIATLGRQLRVPPPLPPVDA